MILHSENATDKCMPWKLTTIISNYFTNKQTAEQISFGTIRLSKLYPFFIILGLSVQNGIVVACVHKLCLVRTITRSQIWARIAKLAPNMYHGIFVAGIENGAHCLWLSSFWPFWLGILGNSACPHDNSSQIRAGITKCAPNMLPDILSAGIEIGRSLTLIFKVILAIYLRSLWNSVCSRDNLQIRTREEL